MAGRFKDFFRKIPGLWQKLRKNWRRRFHLLIREDDTQKDVFSFKLSPRNIFVVVTLSAFTLILLTGLLIAFTPLGIYVTGWRHHDEYRKYREMSRKVDSVELLLAQNQQYIDNFYRILNDEVMPDEMEKGQDVPDQPSDNSDLDLEAHSEAELALREESADLIKTLMVKQQSEEVTVNRRADIQNLFMQPPTTGTIVGYYSVAQSQYGLDIANKPGTLVTSAGDGMVVFAGFDAMDGNVIIIQHHDNVISIYKHNRVLLKTAGAKVAAGEPIAEMGHSGTTDKGTHLHFELWHNGFPLNPLDYLTLK